LRQEALTAKEPWIAPLRAPTAPTNSHGQPFGLAKWRDPREEKRKGHCLSALFISAFGKFRPEAVATKSEKNQ